MFRNQSCSGLLSKMLSTNKLSFKDVDLHLIGVKDFNQQ